VEGTQTVTLNDGRLTVRSAAGASNNKICFIDIEPAGPPTGGTPVTLTSLSPVTEEGSESPGMIRLSRGGSLAEDLTVRLAMSGTALAGTDFIALPALAVIPAGFANLDFPVSAPADAFAEGGESVTLSLLAHPAYIAGESSTATVTIADLPFDSWRFSHFRPLERADHVVSGFEAVPFPGGVANGLSYALGLNPTTATTGMLPLGGINDGGRFALSFKRPAGLAGVRYRVESSPTLSEPWTAIPPEAWIVQPHEDGTETVIARDPFPPGENPGLFLRLNVTPED
jgi:hypothetical protein